MFFANNHAAVDKRKGKPVLNKALYVGMTILENSKILMYDFFYNTLKKHYGPKCELLYSDTDSLLLEIETETVYKDMEGPLGADLFHTSNYPKEHPLHSDKNKKVLGKMKDECAGLPIAECVCLRPKMYSILMVGEKTPRRRRE